MDCSPPGSSVHGILQARILEWVTISFSRGSSWPKNRTRVSCIGGRCFNLWATREALESERERQRFILRNWLTWLWKLASPKSVGCTEKLHILERGDVTVQVQSHSAGRTTSCSEKDSSLFYQAFNWLDEAHPHGRGQSALRKVHWFKC